MAGDPPPLLSALRGAGDWLVFTQYQQANGSLAMAWWKVLAFDVLTSQLIEVAAGAGDLPDPSISATGLVVWNEGNSAGRLLKLEQLPGGKPTPLQLPADTLPVAPRVEGNVIVYLDNQSDPDHLKENWVSYGGHLNAYDLTTSTSRRLDSADDARRPELSNGQVLWYATVPDPGHSSGSVYEMRISPTNGGPQESLHSIGTDGVISPTNAVWFNFEEKVTYAHSLSQGRTFKVSEPGLRSNSHMSIPTYALCGSSLFYEDPSTQFLTRIILD